MADYRFFISRIVLDDVTNDESIVTKELEKDFLGLRYKQLTGLNAQGSPKVYTESFVENNGSEVFVPPTGQVEDTELTLTLLFLPEDDTLEDEAMYASAQEAYQMFLDWCTGYELIYHDNARNRKVRMYLSSSTTPKTDRLYGTPYLEVEFKFKNIYGKSFSLTDTSVIPFSFTV